MPFSRNFAAALSIGAFLFLSACGEDTHHNLILFVPDGMRALSVTPEATPTLARLRDQGVNFANPHALFPTFTMPNSSAMATGHFMGDTGTFSNTIFTGYPVLHAGGSVTPFIENDAVLGDIDEHFDGNFVDEQTILQAAKAQGFSTAAIGKLGPTLMFAHTERSGETTIVVDDSTGAADKDGKPLGIPLSKEMQDKLAAADLPLKTPSRGDNGKVGDDTTPGTTVANVVQQGYFADVVSKVVLPLFKARNKPFVLVFWSRDPDGTQHNQGDSLNELAPGINGPTSLAAVKNADNNLKQIMDALDRLGLAKTTDIVIAADHGFSTISKQSETSRTVNIKYEKVKEGLLPSGFVAIDLAKALGLPLFDPDNKNAAVADNAYPKRGNGLIGSDPSKPDVVVASNGGSDLIYIPNKDREVAGRVVAELLKQDYVSGIFVDDALGSFPGTLSLSDIQLKGSAITPLPAIVLNFKSFSTGCAEPLLCTVEVADTPLQQGQGMHGNFSRADTMNFMAAYGPSFKSGFRDDAPVSNADVGKTIAELMQLKIPFKGSLRGRVIVEALPNGGSVSYTSGEKHSEPDASGLMTSIVYQKVGDVPYFDAAGFPGRTVGLPSLKQSSR
jgi:predicted AlkP superfamily pyrophosphatase or phosphodiesterase